MIKSSVSAWLFLLSLLFGFAFTAEQNPAQKVSPNFIPGEPVAVTVWNRQLTQFRIGWADLNVNKRAEHAVTRITNIPESELTEKIEVKSAQIDGLNGHMFYVGGQLLFGLASQDLSEEEAKDPAAAATKTSERIREVFNARLEQRRPEVILYGLLWVTVTTIILIVFLISLRLFLKRAHARIDTFNIHKMVIGGLDLTPFFRWCLHAFIRFPAFFCILASVYIWLMIGLNQFPYSQPLASKLGDALYRFMLTIAAEVISTLPGLLMVVVILFCTRLFIRALDSFFNNVESGVLEVQWMLPETAKATRRIASMMVWLFAITVAYPYVPGSSSDAFKGVSVFAGLLLTLGSAGMVNQVMSGLVVVYSRMMKPGDMIKVGEVAGQVVELGFLSTKVRTGTGHEVTMPNALLVGTSVANFSRFDPQRGAIITTTITIGYDTPWRQVHALLTLAAERTEGVNHLIKPEIIQTALSDWYVAYELRCPIMEVEKRVPVLSHLHAAIQEAFNEHGVQIMSPNFEAQPEKPVLVPKEAWFLPPAKI